MVRAPPLLVGDAGGFLERNREALRARPHVPVPATAPRDPNHTIVAINTFGTLSSESALQQALKSFGEQGGLVSLDRVHEDGTLAWAACTMVSDEAAHRAFYYLPPPRCRNHPQWPPGLALLQRDRHVPGGGALPPARVPGHPRCARLIRCGDHAA